MPTGHLANKYHWFTHISSISELTNLQCVSFGEKMAKTGGELG